MSAYFARASSAAIPIVDPSKVAGTSTPTPSGDPSNSTVSSPSARKSTDQRQCRNILIYGSCKFEGKGCIYHHPSRPQSPTNGNDRVTSPPPTISAQAPVFVPKGNVMDNPELVSDLFHPVPEHEYDPNFSIEGALLEGVDEEQHSLQHHQDYHQDSLYPQSNYIRQPLNYHLYTIPVHLRDDQPPFFMDEERREELLKRSETIHTIPYSAIALPEELHSYHSLAPLEPMNPDRRKSFGNWASTCYRGTSSTNGNVYALRRIENFRLMHESAFGAIENWSRLRHPNIINVREAFTTRAFNDNSLVIAYDYHPNALTLYDAHIRPKPPAIRNGKMQPQSTQVPERLVWTYIVQIANALKAIHDLGLSARVIDVTRVLVTGKERVRLNCCGVLDVLTFDGRNDVTLQQQDDLVSFGKLIFALCCNNPAVMNNLPKALEAMTRQYSPDLKNVALFLISKPGPHKVIGQLFDMFGSRLLTEMDSLQQKVDTLEGDLMTELENGRLVRLLCKFGFINERPEFDREPRWSETGDRYIIKLFRDYVFHQVDENGNPVVNLSHVLTCLNKLDAGTDEKIMLVSRDEQSCLVVTYREVRICVDAAFKDLARGHLSSAK